MVADKDLDNIEELKKLSPEERITRLKELEEKRKKELMEAEKLIQQSVAEIKAEETLKEEIEEEERKQRETASSEKKEEGKSLEEKISREKQILVDEELSNHKQYQMKLSMEPMTNLYERLRDVYQNVVANGEMSEEQERQIRDLGYAMQYKSDAINHGEYRSAGEEIEDIISASKSILNYIRKGA